MSTEKLIQAIEALPDASYSTTGTIYTPDVIDLINTHMAGKVIVDEPLMERPDRWHETHKDPELNNLPVGVLGSMTYVLDYHNGSPITKGYHQLRMAGDVLMGTVGAREEVVFIHSSTQEGKDNAKK